MDHTKENQMVQMICNEKTLHQLYQSMRIVDPLLKKVLYFKGDFLFTEDNACYHFWNKNTICDNCISFRAYQKNEVVHKINYTPGKIFLVVATPIEIAGKKYVLELLSDATHSMLIENSDESLGKIYNQELKTAIENLNSLVIKDALTGIYNRRYIDDRLPVEIQRNKYKGSPLSIMMLDIDNFKKINDQYGHVTGDAVIKNVAKILKKCIRDEGDWVARYGGEEFLICLPDTADKYALKIAERIKRIISMHPIYKSGINDLNITFSMGIHTITIKDYNNISVEDLIHRADIKLMEAKRCGKNMIKN
ncbi:MAG: GGDEF domain-containing protein [Eubacteriales bacterium]